MSNRYAEMVQKTATPTARSLRIDILPPIEGVCHLDAVTVRELELVASLDVASDAYKYTLFGSVFCFDLSRCAWTVNSLISKIRKKTFIGKTGSRISMVRCGS